MGHSCSGDQAVLRVATLNFSGINNNRFEFHDGSQFFDDLNAKYRLIQEREFPEMKQWKGVLFDKNYKSHRFTVLFGDELIQSLKGKLFSSHDFRILWMQYFREAQMKGAFYNNHKPTED